MSIGCSHGHVLVVYFAAKEVRDHSSHHVVDLHEPTCGQRITKNCTKPTKLCFDVASYIIPEL